MIRISAPFVNSVVAKECLSVCACMFLSIPAWSQYSFTILVIWNRESRIESLESREELISDSL